MVGKKEANDGGRMPNVIEVRGSVSYFLMEFEKLHANEKYYVAQCLCRSPQDDIYNINFNGSFDPNKRTE